MIITSDRMFLYTVSLADGVDVVQQYAVAAFSARDAAKAVDEYHRDSKRNWRVKSVDEVPMPFLLVENPDARH